MLSPIQDAGRQPMQSSLWQSDQPHVNQTCLYMNPCFNTHFRLHFLSRTFPARLYPPGMCLSSILTCYSSGLCCPLLQFFTVISMSLSTLQLGKRGHKYRASFLVSHSLALLVLLCFAELPAVLVGVNPKLPCLAHPPLVSHCKHLGAQTTFNYMGLQSSNTTVPRSKNMATQINPLPFSIVLYYLSCSTQFLLGTLKLNLFF